MTTYYPFDIEKHITFSIATLTDLGLQVDADSGSAGNVPSAVQPIATIYRICTRSTDEGIARRVPESLSLNWLP